MARNRPATVGALTGTAPLSAFMPGGVPEWRRPKATDGIIESLRVGIATGQLGRGDRLPNERDLAREFGVSQPTVREAIRVLEAMGLVEVRHGSGAYVTANLQDFISRSLHTLVQMEEVGIVDIVELRLSLARYSVARAVRRATPGNIELIEVLERTLLKASAEDDYRKTASAAMDYLVAVSAAAHDPVLFTIETFLIELMLALQITTWRKSPESYTRRWVEWHRPFADDRLQLLHALRSRDETAAVEAMVHYLEDQRRLFGAFPELSAIRIGDPEVVRSVADSGLSLPAYRDVQAAALSVIADDRHARTDASTAA